MQSKVNDVNDYLQEIPEERLTYFKKLRKVILENLPKGFKEEMSYGMIGFVVPHELYPAGYHCDPKLPLPFAGLASQKNFISFYHMGIYANENLLKWFVDEYPKHSKKKLDMGKSCLRFKKEEDIPFDLLAQLMTKISVQDWIEIYESTFIKEKK